MRESRVIGRRWVGSRCDCGLSEGGSVPATMTVCARRSTVTSDPFERRTPR
jgi:hypothetical protein